MSRTDTPRATSSDLAGWRELLPARNWGWFLARGLLLVVLGLLALFLPGPAMLGFATVFAGFCLANGVLTVASGVRGARDGEQRWWTLILSGVAGLVIGTMFVLFPLLSTITYALTAVMLVAAWAIIAGALEISAAIRLRKEIRGEWLLALSGTLSILLGLALTVMTVIVPGVSVVSTAWMIGVYAMVAGIALAVLAFRLRKPTEGRDNANRPAEAHPA